MAVTEQVTTDKYAIKCGDCVEVMGTMPDACYAQGDQPARGIHLSIYSLPFVGLYHYSSSPRDLSNCLTYEKFFEHYEFVVREKCRITIPGRVSLVHCMDVPNSNTGDDDMTDFPGDIIRLHRRLGWRYCGRYCVWKEPLAVRNRTMQKNLAHKTLVEDSALCSNAAADYLLKFRKVGKNPIPITHAHGLLEYAGSRPIPADLLRYRGWTGKQTENRYSHWIWRQYASAFWDDIRLDRVLPFKDAGEPDDEKHVHPLQLDVIDRGVELYSNPGETVFTPFMGVGSETYSAVMNGRRAIGIELKPSYYRQAKLNCEAAAKGQRREHEDRQVRMQFEEAGSMDGPDADTE